MPDRRLPAPTGETRARTARIRIATTAAATWLGLAVAAALATAQEPEPRTGVVRSALHDFRVVEVADGLINPHSIAFTPEGDVLVTERPGRLRVIRDGRLLPDPVEGLPEILALGHGAMPMN
jgi:glucose/arabinose dehydrogenase